MFIFNRTLSSNKCERGLKKKTTEYNKFQNTYKKKTPFE